MRLEEKMSELTDLVTSQLEVLRTDIELLEAHYHDKNDEAGRRFCKNFMNKIKAPAAGMRIGYQPHTSMDTVQKTARQK